jgi:dTDP-4-amino-4,6-dideoxygalactose transaminase
LAGTEGADLDRTLAILGGRPLFDEPLHVGRPNLPDRRRFDELLDCIFESRWLTNYGPLVRIFQSRLEELLGVRHCIPVCNGTIALELAYRAIGFRGEVIVPSFTFIATAHALRWQEITPVFCDIRSSDFTLDPELVEGLITPRTSGIVGVHTYGNPCDHGAISEIARRHGLPVVYDAAHAFTNEAGGVPVCRLGDISVLSFHATKFFSTFEGGAVATDDDDLAERVRLMTNFGFAGRAKDRVDHIGTNGKMPEVCAAMGLAMLEEVDRIREANRANFEAYREALAGIPGVVLREPSPALSRSNLQYVIIEVDEEVFGLSRDALVQVLEAENVLARRYFYPGCHRMEPYRSEFPDNGRALPVTDRMAGAVVSLPTGEAVIPTAARWIASAVGLAGEKAALVRQRLEGG